MRRRHWRAHALKIVAAFAVLAAFAVGGVAWAMAGENDEPPAGSTTQQQPSEDDGDQAGTQSNQSGDEDADEGRDDADESDSSEGRDDADEGRDDADEGQDKNGAGAGQRQLQAKGPLDPVRFSTKVSHPLVPLSSVPITVFKGLERHGGADVQVRSESRS